MGRRIEVELTSTRDDGSWTWRAAGARQPKGELSGDLLYAEAKVGDVVKVEADFHLDGIEIVEVFPPKAKKERGDLLELKSRPLRDDELVTTQRVARRDRGDRGRRGDRPGRPDRGERRDRRGGSNRSEARPDRPQRPKPKRLRPKRKHRDALLASVTEEHRPIVEQVVRDGMPGVRAAIEKQNAEAKQAGKPEIDAAPILAIAERNLAAARLAEWRDRADAALATIDDLDLRDLRQVVVVGNDVARDDESRALADQLKAALDERMEKDHGQWLSDLRNAVADGRVVRALRLSSRPVKAGAPLPTELAGELSKQAAAALAPDVEPSRWAIVLDALAFSPVRGAVTPAGIPAEPGEELLDEVRRLSDRIPAIANMFGIDPAQVPRRAKRRRPARSGGKTQDRKPKKTKKRAASKAVAEPKVEAESKAEPDTAEPNSESEVETPEPDTKVEAEPKAESQTSDSTTEATPGTDPAEDKAEPDAEVEPDAEEPKPEPDAEEPEAQSDTAEPEASSEAATPEPSAEPEAGAAEPEASSEAVAPEDRAEPAPVDGDEEPAAESISGADSAADDTANAGDEEVSVAESEEE